MTSSKSSSLPETKTPAEPDAGPQPEADEKTETPAPKPDPTRYGDWEKGGRCIDF
ncbi:MAG: hypothetical protein CBD27_09695 [Rhodospirillaceae bacterium TMED167]|nr:DUF1674 domain-containing protein [Rhodospirillaceae bacterium]OUW25245.1 MAG: hypothetical protein CBD27_09695 [Rhodospirillaceae bacterium TMED167]|tara:strand:+ start:159 stop:323 length:165 start_codon:yes stop_codon:yes gene_type:complete